MTVKDIEDSIVTKLSTDITDWRVERCPEEPEKYEFVHPKGAILVAYEGSEYEDPKANAPTAIKQNRTITIALRLIHKNLFIHHGIYSKLDEIKTSLTGHQVDPGYSKMYPVSDSFLAKTEGCWHWIFIWAFDGEEFNE